MAGCTDLGSVGDLKGRWVFAGGDGKLTSGRTRHEPIDIVEQKLVGEGQGIALGHAIPPDAKSTLRKASVANWNPAQTTSGAKATIAVKSNSIVFRREASDIHWGSVIDNLGRPSTIRSRRTSMAPHRTIPDPTRVGMRPGPKRM